jgi:phage portal protein BeeE
VSLFRRRRGEAALVPAGSTRYDLEQYASQLAFSFGGIQYGSSQGLGGPVQTSYASNPVEPIPTSFVGYAVGGLFDNPVVAGLEWTRLNVFSEARFIWQQLRGGRPGDLFGTGDLAMLEQPWTGGTTGDLLTRFLLDADLAGNAYWARVNTELVRLRPDWVEILLAKRLIRMRINGEDVVRQVGWKRVGYAYWEGGKGATGEPAVFLPDEVAHFAPLPDPLATFRGMSWLTPVVREIQADRQASLHKQAWWENAASPNLAISLVGATTPEKFRAWVDELEREHAGAENAGKTIYSAAGSDVTVIGANMQQADFSNIIGKGEARIALASGIHPVVAGLSEGMQGSSLNAGNYAAAKRATGDKTFRPLWRNMAGSMQVLFPPPPRARLWYDARDVAFLRDDAQDVATIQQSEAATIRTLLDAGYTPESVKAAVLANDWSVLQHSGLYSVQLQKPGGDQAAPAVQPPPARAVEDVVDAEVVDDPVVGLTSEEIDRLARRADMRERGMLDA